MADVEIHLHNIDILYRPMPAPLPHFLAGAIPMYAQKALRTLVPYYIIQACITLVLVR